MYDSMIIYRSFYDAVKELDDVTAAAVFRAMCEYGLNGSEPELSGVSKAIFSLMKPQIDANNRRKENGFKGGRPKTETEPKENQTETKTKPNSNQTETKSEPNVNVNVNANANVNVNDNVNAKEKKMFPDGNIKEAVDTWNDVFAFSDVPKVTIVKTGSKRAKMLQARFDEFGKDKVLEAIRLAAASAFLKSSSWFSFDWLICPNNFVKVIEGNYQDHAKPAAATQKNSAAEELDDFYRRAVAWAEGE